MVEDKKIPGNGREQAKGLRKALEMPQIEQLESAIRQLHDQRKSD